MRPALSCSAPGAPSNEQNLRNFGQPRGPYGTGLHPYLIARTPSVDQCELTLPAATC
jgi:hypothetical protein